MVPAANHSDVMLITGEPSGDAYAAEIAKALLTERPGLVLGGMGGRLMAEAGVEIDQSSDGLAVMGLFPVLLRLPEFMALGRRLEARIRAAAPKVVITVDYPGFNFRLLAKLQDMRAAGTRFIHVVAPQVWAWKPRRTKKVAKLVDRLMCFFPFEPPLFRRFGLDAVFIGHPLADLVTPQPTAAIDADLGLQTDDELLLLAPGSRYKEVVAMLPIMDAAVRLARPRLRGANGRPPAIAVSVSPDLPRELYNGATDLPLSDHPYRALLTRAHVAAITSGTATLEAALMGLPHIICYRGDPISARIGMRLFLADHFGLPNIVHDRRIAPELFQEEFTPSRLAAHLVRQWRGPQRRRARGVLATTRMQLGGGGALKRISEIVLAEIDGRDRVRPSA